MNAITIQAKAIRAKTRLVQNRRARGQNAILDRGLATILATVAIIGALAAYFLFAQNNNAQAEQSQIASISAEVDNLYGSQSSYVGLTTAIIASSGALPPAWVVAGVGGAGIASVYRSAITLAPVTNVVTGLIDGAWTLTLNAVPNAACLTLASTNVGSSEYGVSINGTGAPTGPTPAGTNPLPTPAAAAVSCTKGANTLVFYLT